MADGLGHDEEQTAPIPAATVSPPEPSSPAPDAAQDGPVPRVGTATARDGGKQGLRRWINPENRWFLPLVGLVAYLLLLLTNFLADWMPLHDRTTSGVLARQPIALQPASWAFTIWVLIAVLLGLFVVLSLTPVGQHDTRVRRIIGLFVVACVANIIWQFFWHWEQLLLALIVVVVMWAALVVISVLGRRAPSEGRLQTLWQKLTVQVPFSVALGWSSVLVLLTFALWADRSWGSGNPFSDRTWAVILMIVGVVIAAAFALFARDALVPLVFLWFFVAVVQEQWDNSTLVVVVGVVAAIASSALALAAYSLRYNPDALARLSPRRRVVQPPSTPGI
jgi:benzodiazapine receptor